MKNLLVLFLLIVVTACGSKKEEEVISIEEAQIDLLVDDGQGLIFTSKSDTTTIQFKLFDNVLREIYDTEASPISNYTFNSADTNVYLYNVTVRGVTYNKISCDSEQNLAFKETVNWENVFLTTDLVIANDTTFKCHSGDVSFDLTIFDDDNKIRPDLFAGYFDFVNFSFRGKVRVTDLSYTESDYPESSTIVWFE